jgi:hypothetical protein
MSVVVIIGFAGLAGFMLFLIWFVDPNIFGTVNY